MGGASNNMGFYKVVVEQNTGDSEQNNCN